MWRCNFSSFFHNFSRHNYNAIVKILREENVHTYIYFIFVVEPRKKYRKGNIRLMERCQWSLADEIISSGRAVKRNMATTMHTLRHGSELSTKGHGKKESNGSTSSS